MSKKGASRKFKLLLNLFVNKLIFVFPRKQEMGETHDKSRVPGFLFIFFKKMNKKGGPYPQWGSILAYNLL